MKTRVPRFMSNTRLAAVVRSLTALLAMAMLSGTVCAATLGSFDLGSSTQPYFSGIGRYNRVRLSLVLGGDFANSTAVGVPLFNLILSAADVGKTFTVATEPGFADAVGLLTNGINDNINYVIVGLDGPGPIGSVSEAALFFGDDTGARGIDFSGATIDDIRLTLNTLSFATPGSDLNGDGNWTDTTLHATVAVTGAVPLPTSALLLASCLFGLAGRVGNRKA